MQFFKILQAKLNWTKTGAWNPQFRDSGRGMMGATGFIVGTVGGLHMGISLMIGYIFWSGIGGLDPPSFLLPLLHWSVYMSLLCGFHFMEFLTTALWQQKDLSYDSFIVNHSLAYTIAACAAWVEYLLGAYFFPQYKHNTFVASIGFIIVLIGQSIRTISMWTCGSNFSHKIMYNKFTENPEHTLVTNGIYSILRHPSYFGWFYWSIGTQILLCNPLCIVAYTYASWNFFKNRIPEEERTLQSFYQGQYVDYCRRTSIGIPFIPSTIAGNNQTTHNQ